MILLGYSTGGVSITRPAAGVENLPGRTDRRPDVYIPKPGSSKAG
jgi:hypothetical protein